MKNEQRLRRVSNAKKEEIVVMEENMKLQTLL